MYDSERHYRGRLSSYPDDAEKALILYFCMEDPDTPAWAKAVIVGVLGYFMFPMDAVPDFTPGIGLVDDLGALAAALAIVALHIKPEPREKARDMLKQWFSAG